MVSSTSNYTVCSSLKRLQKNKWLQKIGWARDPRAFSKSVTDNSIVSVKLMDFVITLKAFKLVPRPPVIATKSFVIKILLSLGKLNAIPSRFFSRFLALRTWRQSFLLLSLIKVLLLFIRRHARSCILPNSAPSLWEV